MSAIDDKEASFWLIGYLNEHGLVIPKRSKMEKIDYFASQNSNRIWDLKQIITTLKKETEELLQALKEKMPVVEAVHDYQIKIMEMVNGHERRLKRIEEILKIPEPQQKPAGDAGTQTERESNEYTAGKNIAEKG